MQVYLVGGAVRDELLGRPVTERDWVVVGANAEELEALGYRSVGRDFPVFLHPDSHEEYALARLERKTGPGYRGFVTDASRQVTLEQDLQRRDLTINAMARDPDGVLIDPFNGRGDLERRVLRHVSDAFVEDPVRVLRVARFAARFADLGFTVAPETVALMRRMVAAGEIDALVPERVWQEMERALCEPRPEAFFDTLDNAQALPHVLPECPWGEAPRRALQRAAQLSDDPTVRFAAWLAETDPAAIMSMCERLRVPTEYRELAALAAQLAPRVLPVPPQTAAAELDVLESADGFRRPERFQKVLLGLQCWSAPDPWPWERLRRALTEAASVSLAPEDLAQLRGAAIAAALRALRLIRLQQLEDH